MPLPAIAGIDWQAALQSVDQRPGLLRKVLAGFRNDYGAAGQALLLDSGASPQALQRYAHGLKSAAATIGAQAVVQMACALETALRQDRLADAQALRTPLAAALATLAASMDAALGAQDAAHGDVQDGVHDGVHDGVRDGAQDHAHGGAVPASGPARQPAGDGIERPHILVVDDQELNRDLLALLLEDQYTITTTGDGAGVPGWAAEHQPDLILLDVLMDGVHGHEVLRRLKEDAGTAHIPVIFITGLNSTADEAHGLELGASDYIPKPFSHTVVRTRVALHLQLARQRRELETLAQVDSLTGLPNRRRFDEHYAAEWRRAQRNGAPLSVLLVDVDSFRQYNDRHGHAMGDQALRALGRVLRACARRPADLAARCAGGQFALVLPETDAAAAFDMAQRIRAQAEKLAGAAAFTVSVGGATSALLNGESRGALLDAAAQQLNRAKADGGNRAACRAAHKSVSRKFLEEMEG
jgi:diguanylate cyclase (GGDEF)-like protein